MSNAPNPIEVLRNTLNQLNFQGTQRAHVVGLFSNEWNKLVAASGTPETIVINEEGVELAIERRSDGKWQFKPTTFDGQRPSVNTPSMCEDNMHVYETREGISKCLFCPRQWQAPPGEPSA